MKSDIIEGLSSGIEDLKELIRFEKIKSNSDQNRINKMEIKIKQIEKMMEEFK